MLFRVRLWVAGPECLPAAPGCLRSALHSLAAARPSHCKGCDKVSPEALLIAEGDDLHRGAQQRRRGRLLQHLSMASHQSA